jgi:hypothetical protein
MIIGYFWQFIILTTLKPEHAIRKQTEFAKDCTRPFSMIFIRSHFALEELQKDLDHWVDGYDKDRTHQGKMCCGRTPMGTCTEGKHLWDEKVNQLNQLY